MKPSKSQRNENIVQIFNFFYLLCDRDHLGLTKLEEKKENKSSINLTADRFQILGYTEPSNAQRGAKSGTELLYCKAEQHGVH